MPGRRAGSASEAPPRHSPGERCLTRHQSYLGRGFRAAVGAQRVFLSDAGRKVQKDLDIQEYTDPHNNPMIPHTLVLKPGLVIHSVYNGYWYWGRPSIDDLWRDLHEVTREIRPDRDLAAPGLRENYEAGDRSMHYAYLEADLRPRPG